jgi:hypothetical protein
MEKTISTNDLSPEKIWERQKGKLKVMFPVLTSEDLEYDYGMKEVMLMKLQGILKMSREELTYLMGKL